MSREKKIHELIENQETSDKEVVWNKLQEKLRQEETTETIQDIDVKDNGNTLSLAWRKNILWIILASTVALFGTLILCLTLIKKNEPQIRYCTDRDYTSSEYSLTIKEYAISNNKNILYFDWYEETEHRKDRIYELINTKEIICIKESIMDMETGYILTLGITDNRTEIDLFDAYGVCVNEIKIGNVDVKWCTGTFASYSKFEYEGYKYYLEIEDSIDGEMFLSYIQSLLS